MQQSQDRLEAFGNVVDILAGKTDPCGLSTDVFFAPILSDSHAGAGTEISAAKDSSSHERKMVNLLGKQYFNFCAWKQ